MLKMKTKRFSVLLTVLSALLMMVMAFAMWITPATTTASAAEATATLSFASTSQRTSFSTSQQVWEQNGITFTNNKASSTSNVANYSNPVRLYKSSEIIVEHTSGQITKVEFTCNNASYASELKNSTLEAGTITVSSAKVTVTLSEPSKEVHFTKLNAQIRLNSLTVYYKEAIADCAHDNVSTKYDSAKGEHYDYCEDCKTELEDTREACNFGEATIASIGGGKHTLTQVCDTCQGEKVTTEACSEFTEGEWETVDGVHTRTLTCTLCGGEQVESDDCQISEGEWVREGDEHSKTGTCTVCGDSTTVTEACTLNYTNVSNDDKTHTTTSTCSVCGQDSEPEVKACTFEESWEVGDEVLTYTCEYCAYFYTEAATLYTVTYSVPEGVEAPAASIVADGYSAVLSDEVDNYDEYTFVGWTNEAYSQNTQAPEVIYEAGEDLKVSENITLYALYTYAEGTTEETWNLVTAANQLAVGKEIVIVASGSNYALGSNQANNNRTAVAVTKDTNTNTVTWTTAVQTITLEAGTVDGTWAFYVAGGTGTNAVNGGYLYAAGSGSNYLRTQVVNDANGSWSISITSEGVASITAQGTNANNQLKKNSQSALFSCYASGQQTVSIYVKTGGAIIYYTTGSASEAPCEHVNTTEEIDAPTCENTGWKKVVCDDCGFTLEEGTIAKLEHEYVDNFCVNGCGKQDPETIDYSGYYYISFTHNSTVYYVDNSELASNNRYYARTDAPATDSVTAKYVFRLEKTATGIYSLYELDGDLYQADITVELVDGAYRFSATVDGEESMLLFNNNNGQEKKYVKFYKATNAGQANYAQDITLTPVEIGDMSGATLTLGEDIAVNFKADIADSIAEDVVMYFTVNGETKDVQGEKGEDGSYVYSLNLPPQYMAVEILAELKYGEAVIDSYSYSIKQYAQNKLNAEDSSDELKQLVSDMLYYGDAAYKYYYYETTGETTDETPATEGVENLLAASNAQPTEAVKMSLEKNTEISTYPAYFKSATVWFASVNQIRVTIAAEDLSKVSLTINGVEKDVTSNMIYTDGIYTTDFGTSYEFVLSYDGVVMQTLTYSVNAYAYSMLKDGSTASAEMKALAKTLYNYGVSAVNYAKA